jgi:hypothetical protein
MGYARKHLVSLHDTPYYHVIARCVRRAWLWGLDEYAGKDYSHRKLWVVERLEQLCSIFSIEVCAYAVMSNHYHLVLYVDADRARQWTQQEVIERWSRLFQAPTLVQRWQSGEALAAEQRVAESIVEHWRARLCDISWFMRCLNEHLARLASGIALRPFSDEVQKRERCIPYALGDYLGLIDWSARAIRAGKRGAIDAHLPPILKRLNIDAEAWEVSMSRRGTVFGRAIGRLDVMRLHAATLGQSWIRGVRSAERLYNA